MKKSIALDIGCVAGASQESDYEAILKNAGFNDILIVDSKNDLNVYRERRFIEFANRGRSLVDNLAVNNNLYLLPPALLASFLRITSTSSRHRS
ncbi:hypothetical protein AU210_016678 [Fusarium oxysporum f. sp. radicis-cucumerinum]|uniref:Uncharacterized protein n=2 Tax=Fusarium oxysporum TaxID=5507 RepID=A0A2H3FN84_FUSOX|nr:hypothetical protein AU210_016678 [Fusarium oxysporum f. sp. radicis-cucumerinum]RKK15051.1 hypothetical protein BFJ65_g11595 [Fusarium oxysporum f. sp. cepae]RKK27260.1 hypothetical protein BFJ67_g16217 [Fusarium oxysporum f. sp. cepae]RKK32038.1 hypothetical protein BFJ66_g15559 [Fusarium oxysporum f. sp. cepae]